MSKIYRFPSIYRIAQVCLDVAVAMIATLLAFVVRFEGQIPAEYIFLIKAIVTVGIPCRLLIYWCFNIYSQIWRLFSLRDFWSIFQAVSLYCLILVFMSRLLLPRFIELPILPLGAAVMDWIFCLSGMVLLRFLRSYKTRPRRSQKQCKPIKPKRFLLLGAGRAGAQIVRETLQSSKDLKIMGFLDDDSSKLNRQVEGIKVLGTINQLGAWATRLKIDEVLITIPSASSDRIQQIVSIATQNNILIKILPPLQELLLDRNLSGQIREIRLEDLLGRPEIFLDFDQKISDDLPSATAQIRDRTILVTGAGGTIGSELCRQIARLNPRRLILLGRGENSIFQIEQELRSVFPTANIIPVIADVRHTSRMSKIFHRYKPEIVFHAAAHKHVPLMEFNPTEAIENNAIASANLALLADNVGVETFVLVSTDKAVSPNNFMGLSKRLAELLVSAVANDSQTRFLAVRFGNVLGSRGSVVPIFQRQIAKGGPVTVTDPAMTRYFMTTPEAARLVIQSMAVGETGQTLVLDMGKPINIYALAEQLIRLKGYTPGQDIEIKITGIRPGEKLHESLVDQDEVVQDTPHPQIYCLQKIHPHHLLVPDTIDQIQTALDLTDPKAIWEAVIKYVSTPQQHLGKSNLVDINANNLKQMM